MKHAFLIIAHSLFDQLQLLINLLDDERNDIYVHIDKKCNFPNLTSKYSKLIVLKKRIDVRWGSVSQIETELLLFETAYNNPENYSYYHLLSGVDMPIKSNDYIHKFFKEHSGKEFIGFCQVEEIRFIYRINRIHLIRKHFRSNNKFLKMLRFYSEKIVNIFYNSPQKNKEYKWGPNWVSITDKFIQYLIEHKKNILKEYKYSLCGDEIYKQTLAWNSPFRNTLYTSNNENESCKRLVDWVRGNPYVYGNEIEKDIQILKSSEAIFARKFDFSKFPDIIRLIQQITYKDE